MPRFCVALEELPPVDSPARLFVEHPPGGEGPGRHERRIPLRLGEPSTTSTGRGHEQPTISNGILITLLHHPRKSPVQRRHTLPSFGEILELELGLVFFGPDPSESHAPDVILLPTSPDGIGIRHAQILVELRPALGPPLVGARELRLLP